MQDVRLDTWPGRVRWHENDADRDAAANYNDPQQMDHEEDYADVEEEYVPDDLYEGSMFPPKSEDWYLTNYTTSRPQ